MIDAHDLNVMIAGTPILRNVTLAIPSRSAAGLIGRNGAGKTTLLRSIMGLIPVQSGAVTIDGKDLLAMAPHHRASLGIGYMPEDRRVIPNFTVEENILVPVWATGHSHRLERLSWIYDLMPEIARFRERRALSLSGGQQKLVALARALIIGSNVLLLDEPFEGVAPALAQRLFEVISALKEEGLSIMLCESDHIHSAQLVDEVYEIERGEVRPLEMRGVV